MMIKLLAFDLDGTLTQHKSKMEPKTVETMRSLKEKYHLLMVGAGTCTRIDNQMDHFPIDIIGNYGMQEGRREPDGSLAIVKDAVLPCDRESVDRRVTDLRNRYGFTEFKGGNVEYHPSGCVTIPLLGTKADLPDKLAFDPDRKKRRAIYKDVKALFPEYIVFVGGSSSFDMAPRPYDKAYALSKYCEEHGFSHDEVAYVGDDYGIGGNDESVYLSDFHYVTIDDYRCFPELMKQFL